MKPLQVSSACARPPATASSSSARETLSECMTMTCSFLCDVVVMSLNRACRGVDDEAGGGCCGLTRVGIRIPLRERQVYVVPAAVERIGLALTGLHRGIRGVGIAAGGIARCEIGEHRAPGGTIEGGRHQ